MAGNNRVKRQLTWNPDKNVIMVLGADGDVKRCNMSLGRKPGGKNSLRLDGLFVMMVSSVLKNRRLAARHGGDSGMLVSFVAFNFAVVLLAVLVYGVRLVSLSGRSAGKGCCAFVRRISSMLCWGLAFGIVMIDSVY